MIIEKVSYENKVYWSVDTNNTLIPYKELLYSASKQLSKGIDTAAGTARASFVSPGSYIDQEYLLAKQEAQAWLDGGKDQSAIPSSVEDHIAMFDVDAETAAQEIVATAAQWEQALTAIRRVRLGGKSDVRAAETIEAAEQAAQEAIAALNAIRPQEGAL
ncbi:putative tail fiber assembly protein [Halomonas phage phiHAP-1]|uniref:Putative tail fiber assembly protein n=1 Tax=Halomonas phage phiHAP-1 (isolate -/Gulf of Mexico/-/2001) TaxID=1283337 RepID=B0ZSG6_BPHA1|nr:putative tail fiber assembly protein [Halomonas phage phiHAP-1]ABY90386.1 putative tail fiber assembly protein [Halomonas phage phiHAP-1]